MILLSRFLFRSLALPFALCISAVAARSQILLTVDISDPAAITVVGTGAFAAANYTGSATTFPVRLLDFFTANPGQEQPLLATSSTLATDGGPVLNTFMAGRAIPGTTSFVMRNSPSSAASYSTSAPAFTGTAIFDLTSFGASLYIDYLPSAGHAGNIIAADGTTVVGTYTVVGAIPEPATFAALGGAGALLAAGFRRRPRGERQATA